MWNKLFIKVLRGIISYCSQKINLIPIFKISILVNYQIFSFSFLKSDSFLDKEVKVI